MGLEVSRPPYVSGEVVQVVNFQTGEWLACGVIIPLDDTIPQIAEGTLIMTLAFTPKFANSKLKIEIVAHASRTTGISSVAALFRDAGNDAIACGSAETSQSSSLTGIVFLHWIENIGTVDEITFTVRLGNNLGNCWFNGPMAGRWFAGVLASSITITEIKV